MEREVLEFDVQFVGAGPAGLAGAIHLATLIERHNASVAVGGAPTAGGSGEALPEVTIAVLEKSRRVGAHGLSGAILDPRALDELMPDWRAKGCPVASNVATDDVYFLWDTGQFRLPLLPPVLENHGNMIVSLGRWSSGWRASPKRRACWW